MINYLFSPDTPSFIKLKADENQVFPVNRIFCVGRNYAAHAAEMGVEVDREAPFYFTKTPSASYASGGVWPYPPMSENCHFEMELVVAIGADLFQCDEKQAMKGIYGYCCGLDMTRRDLQLKAREKQRPWDTGKDFENSAVFAPLTKAEDYELKQNATIELFQNGEIRQKAMIGDLIHSVPEIIIDLSKFYHLRAGDVIMTGTPAGVGAVAVGDHILGKIEGLDNVEITVGEGV